MCHGRWLMHFSVMNFFLYYHNSLLKRFKPLWLDKGCWSRASKYSRTLIIMQVFFIVNDNNVSYHSMILQSTPFDRLESPCLQTFYFHAMLRICSNTSYGFSQKSDDKSPPFCISTSTQMCEILMEEARSNLCQFFLQKLA